MSKYITLPNTFLVPFAVALIRKKSDNPSHSLSAILIECLIVSALINLARFIWAFIVFPKYRSSLRHLPNPPGEPSLLMGHFWQILATFPGDVLRSWANSVPNDGLIRYLDFLNLERVAVVNPAALADVLVHHCYDFEKPPQLRKGISRILGLGLFLAEGDVHKTQRKLLMPAFAYRHVKDLYPMFWEKSRELVSAISASMDSTGDVDAGDGMCTEVNQWASRATLDIIGRGGFGQDFNAIQDPDNALSQTYRGIFVQSGRGQILGVLGFLLPQWLIRHLPFLRNDKMKQSSNFIRSFCRSAIEAKRANASVEEEDGRRDILNVAMDAGVFSDEELIDQMMTFLAAGHETTASALTWAIYLLSTHPEIQTRLRNELQTHLPNPSTPATSSAIESLPYLRAVCRETLRLYPPVAVTIRVAVRNTFICNVPIPEGTTIMIPPWAVNASKELWGEDAAQFVPERWLKSVEGHDGEGKGTNYDFLTFLHGPRSCIGQGFAMGEMHCLVAAWVGAFETQLRDADFVPVIRGGITAKPKGGLHVRVKAVGRSDE